jgi:RNA polymerase sigma factor (sigma-70 family)
MTSPHAAPPLEALLAHRAWVRSLARRLADNAVDADDLEQDAWLAAARARPHDGTGIRAWFAKVMRNRAAERHRLGVHRDAREARAARPGEVPSGTALVVDAEAHTRVVQAVLALEEPYRETVLLRFYEGLPPRDVAARMGVPVDTVRTRLRRAAEVLRVALGGERDDWLGALAPLLDLRRGAPLPTATAVAGGIAMKLSTKIAVAALALVLGVGLAVRYGAHRDAVQEAPARAPETTAHADGARAPARVARTTGFDIGGTTTSAGVPASAHVTAQRIGAARDPLTWTGLRVQTLSTPPAAAPDSQADADAAGTFLLPGLAPGVFRVHAVFADGRSAVRIVDVTADAPHARVVLNAPDGGLALHGRAVHADGTPFAGWIRLQQNLYEDSLWMRTDAAGAFAFAGLLPTRSWLFAVDENTATTASVRVQLPFDGEYAFTVDRPTALRRGRVVAADDESPVTGALVSVRSGVFGRTQFEFTTTTKADGSFEGRWAGRAALTVSAAGFVRGNADDDGKTDSVVVRLARGVAVEGRVLASADEKPVAGAVVRARLASQRDWAFETTARSGADGAFRLEGVAPGDVDVFVWGGGWVSSGSADARRGGPDPFVVHIDPGSPTKIDLHAEPSASVEGQILDASGSPSAMASVSALPAKYFDGFAWRSTSDEAGADGKFVLRDLLPGVDHTFSAWQVRGETYTRSAPVRTESGRTIQVTLRLDPARRLEVTVLEQGTDAPLRNAVVAVCRAGAEPSGEWGTGSSGRVEIAPVPGGRIGVRARAAGHAPSPQDVAVEEIDATHLRATVRLAPGKVLAGRVELPESVDAESVMMTIRLDPDVATGGPRRKFTSWDNRSAPAIAADGSFRYDDLEDGAYVINAWTRGWSGTAKARAGDADVVVAALPAAQKGEEVRVRVLDVDGSPVADASVQCLYVFDGVSMDGSGAWRKQASPRGNLVPVHDGAAAVTLPRRDSGRGELWIAVFPAPPRKGVTPCGAAVVAVPDPPPAEIEVRLPRDRRIAGRVVGPDGSGVAGVRVSVHAASCAAFEWMLMAGMEEQGGARTGPDGAFDVGGLGDFTYRLSFTVPSGFAPAMPVKAAAGTTGVEVRLLRGFEPVVTVLDASGRPLEGCRVYAMVASTGPMPAAPSLSATTSAEGAAKLPPLDRTGRYTLQIDPPEGRDDLLHTWSRDWTPADATFRLEQAFSIAGVVRDAAGSPLSGATVTYTTQPFASRTVLCADDGTFRVGGLAARAKVSLRAVARGDVDRGEGDAVEATAGDANVSLVVDAAAALRVRVVGIPPGASVPYRLAAPTRGPATYRDDRVPPGGVLRFGGLDRSAKYRLFVGPTETGLYALSEEMSPSADEVVLRLVQGEVLAGRVNLPAGVDTREVTVYAGGDGWLANTTVDAQGKFSFPGVPPHAARVDAFVYRQGKNVFRGTCTTPSGTDVVLDLQPEPGGR